MLVSKQPSILGHAPVFGWTLRPTQDQLSSRTILSSTEDAFHWTVDVPGVDEPNLELEVEGREVRLKAKREDDDSARQQSFRWLLPKEADPDTLTAHLARGVLKLTVNKYPSAKPRKVSIHQHAAA